MAMKKDFKETASSIFKDVLVDKPMTDPLLHKDADAQMRNSEIVHEDRVVSRLHVFIRGELENKLLDEVNRRKKDKAISTKMANKRAVVEEALERFL